MTWNLKERLLEVSGAMASSTNNRRGQNGHRVKHGNNNHHLQGKTGRRANSLTEHEIVRRLEGGRGRGSPGLRRRFIVRLATALHSYGSSASRTEYLIEKAANRIDVEVNIAVFPSLILLDFPVDEESCAVGTRKETHMLTVDSELDVDKLGRADHLANHVGKETPLLLAYWRLKAIATSAPEFGRWWWRLLGYALSASMSAQLFFDGSLWDGLLALPLGLIVGCMDLIGAKSSLFASVLEFTAALVVSTGARVLCFYITGVQLCFFSLVLGSLVQLLPGMSLTLGVSEMVAKAHVSGTSRIMYALFSALQLGFGISVGENIIFWAPAPTPACQPSGMSFWWNILWFAGFSVSSNVLLNARLDQWPGMIVTSVVGYIVSTLAALRLTSNTSSVIASLAVGLTGTAYSHFQGDLPLVMVLSGILLLVPGGIGVRGVATMLQDDVLSGMGFVFNMLIVGLSITIGLLISKIVFPAGLYGMGKTLANNKSTLATQLEEDEATDSESGSDEEDMAI
ncbi:hypothetical protein R1flu_013199 [Riccia fluitans]|uniref:Threonine/serine exporter-like N-terminal domain-containing protein n=1 Tax=Riccia fluitans TaxID=41844 RepID=A0ABD1YCN3_9MARC